MSFWAGVVQGVKDIDVLKEKEALADERQSVRDEETAYRDRMDAVKAKQQEFADERALAWRREDQATAAEEAAYRREQDALAAEERAAAAAGKRDPQGSPCRWCRGCCAGRDEKFHCKEVSPSR